MTQWAADSPGHNPTNTAFTRQGRINREPLALFLQDFL